MTQISFIRNLRKNFTTSTPTQTQSIPKTTKQRNFNGFLFIVKINPQNTLSCIFHISINIQNKPQSHEQNQQHTKNEQKLTRLPSTIDKNHDKNIPNTKVHTSFDQYTILNEQTSNSPYDFLIMKINLNPMNNIHLELKQPIN